MRSKENPGLSPEVQWHGTKAMRIEVAAGGLEKSRKKRTKNRARQRGLQ